MLNYQSVAKLLFIRWTIWFMVDIPIIHINSWGLSKHHWEEHQRLGSPQPLMVPEHASTIWNDRETCRIWIHVGHIIGVASSEWETIAAGIHLQAIYIYYHIYIYNSCIYISFTHRHTHIYIYIHNGHVAKSDIDASNELIGNFEDIFYVHPPILQSMITQIDRFCGCKKGWIYMDGWMDGWMDKLVDRFV